jgi:hypothetical protein
MTDSVCKSSIADAATNVSSPTFVEEKELTLILSPSFLLLSTMVFPDFILSYASIKISGLIRLPPPHAYLNGA